MPKTSAPAQSWKGPGDRDGDLAAEGRTPAVDVAEDLVGRHEIAGLERQREARAEGRSGEYCENEGEQAAAMLFFMTAPF